MSSSRQNTTRVDFARPSPVALDVCERALAVVRDAQAELGFELELVDINGEPDLEAQYREHLPVIEIDGARAFTCVVEPDALRTRLRPLLEDGSRRAYDRRWQNRGGLCKP